MYASRKLFPIGIVSIRLMLLVLKILADCSITPCMISQSWGIKRRVASPISVLANTRNRIFGFWHNLTTDSGVEVFQLLGFLVV